METSFRFASSAIKTAAVPVLHRLAFANLRKGAPNFQFALGDCIKHKQFAYRGVVYGYDAKCKQTEAWLRRHCVNLARGGDQPFYHVLVDVRDNHGTTFAYVAEEQLQPVKLSEPTLKHPLIEKMFVGFDFFKNRYVPRDYIVDRYAQQHPSDTSSSPASSSSSSSSSA